MVALVNAEVSDLRLREAIAYHLGWSGTGLPSLSAEPARAAGKKFRTLLAALAYETAATASSTVADAAGPVLPFACAVEMLHNFTLIHDDIQDGDRARRGRPSLWTVCGVPQAINVGDCMFALAVSGLDRLSHHEIGPLDRLDLTSRMARCTVRLTIGQAMDLADAAPDTMSTAGYATMIEGKTAALTSYAAYGGGLLGGGRELAEHLGEFGRLLGLAFQVRDDMLGIWGSTEETGKPIGSDLVRRKKTLPVALAFEHADGRDAGWLRAWYSGGTPVDARDIDRIEAILRRHRIRELTQEIARDYQEQALAALADAAARTGLPPTHPPLRALGEMAEFATERIR
ncbi:MAG: polyprenyl synthetase family protein [Streptomycetaceae bacterium]|nr:polyprenyl synthetase family protein [Streptomycetaceae bacterium]